MTKVVYGSRCLLHQASEPPTCRNPARLAGASGGQRAAPSRGRGGAVGGFLPVERAPVIPLPEGRYRFRVGHSPPMLIDEVWRRRILVRVLSPVSLLHGGAGHLLRPVHYMPVHYMPQSVVVALAWQEVVLRAAWPIQVCVLSGKTCLGGFEWTTFPPLVHVKARVPSLGPLESDSKGIACDANWSIGKR